MVAGKAAKHAVAGRSAETAEVPARLSASLILLSPLRSPSSDGFDYRVCLLKRSSTMAAAPSTTVFPGGNLDKADITSASTLDPSSEGEDAQTVALKVCALRETFEETGLLVKKPGTKTSISKEKLSELRQAVYKDAGAFLDVYQKAGENAMPSLASLLYWSRWITPINVPKRFDTAFFLHILPATIDGDEQSPLLVADGSESLSAEWISPRKAINACIDLKDISFLPPQLYLLAELARLPTLRQVKEHAKTRKLLSILPQMKRVGKKADTIAFVYPGDEEFDGNPEDKGARHRAYAGTLMHPTKGLIPIQPPQVRGLHRLNVKGLEDMAEGNVEENPAGQAKL